MFEIPDDMYDITQADVLAVYQQLKDRYPLILTNTLALDDGFTVDCAILVGKAHGQIIQLYEHEGIFILDVLDESKTMGTHWHPIDVENASKDIAEFMEGTSVDDLCPFR